MRPRGWLLAVVAVLCATLAPSVARASSTPAVLTLSLPEPITGCYYYGANANDSLRAILDLVRPSAYTTSVAGTYTGAQGPITQAELTSLSPETVVYNVNTSWQWSNGAPFSANDLRAWYTRSRAQLTPLTDGYRSIGSLTVNASLDQVTVVFATPYSDWNALFNDISQQSVPTKCQLRTLANEPSLGPYEIRAVSATGATLVRDPYWKGPRPRFDRIEVRTGLSPVHLPRTDVVDYRYFMTQGELASTTNNTALQGHEGSSDRLVVVGFSPHRPLTVQLAVRQFLGWAIDRQKLINTVLGPVTYSQGLAASTLFSQGQRYYPGYPGSSPLAQGTSTPLTSIPSSVAQDCVVCAASVLSEAGYVRRGPLWRTPQGHRLVINVAVGPSSTDLASAKVIVAQWRAQGVTVVTHAARSDVAVASLLAHGHDDAGIMTVITGAVTSMTARSWTQRNFGNSYDLGWRSQLIDQWYASALDTFNPNDAAASWLDIDQQISTQAWERPLFTMPSIVTWSSDVAGVYGSTSLAGFVDQVPTWGLIPPVAPSTKH